MYLTLFIKWECAPKLLGLRLFPDAKEITESMGCLYAIRAHARECGFNFATRDVTAVVVGDGAKPRTAALACFLTRWRRVIAVDPILDPAAPGLAGGVCRPSFCSKSYPLF